MEGLFGQDFEINISRSKPDVKALVSKTKKAKKETDVEADATKLLKSKKLSLQERLSIIKENVLKTLGRQIDNVVVIRDLGTFSAYIDKAIEKGIIAIDTETNNSTDPATCKMMGLCLYVPGEKQAYIPNNHVNIETGELLPNQLTYEDCRAQLQRVLDNHVYILMHNGKFDYEVLKATCGICVPPNWDTLIGARLIDENKFADKKVSLKSIYVTEIDPTQEKYSIEGLFEHIPYRLVDPDLFALYAATDSLMTYKVWEWEKPYFEGEENSKLKWLADNIEMPIVQVTAEMELRGVCIDQDLGARLKAKYTKQLEDVDAEINEALKELLPTIEAWKLTPEANDKSRAYVSEKSKMSDEKIAQAYPNVDAEGRRYKEAKPKVEQLEDPINLASPTQLAILFYDILKCPQVSKKSPRGTGEEELETIAEKMPDLKICKLLVERRGIVKLITTYIDVIPELAKHWPDGRIRYRLSSMGTDTGRFASGGKFRFLDENDEPVVLNSINSQNIPSHNPEVRLLFKAAPGYRIVGSDYSGQEVRLAAYLSQDPVLLKSYAEDKDVYASIASSMFGLPYEDCLEFYPEGTELEIDGQKIIAGKKTHVNKAGKERRSVGKTMVLAGNYGMGGAGAGSLMGKSAKEGEELLTKYFTMFKGLKKAIDKSKEVLKKQGYVEDVVGRRRRLPDIYLKPYEVSLLKQPETNVNFNPFLNCENRQVKDPRVVAWEERVSQAQAASHSGSIPNKKYEEMAKAAKKEGVLIQAFTGRIAQAERQCFNAMIQGSAGTLTKKAMIDIFNDEELKKYDAHLIITVHDEVLVECKEEYAELVEKRLPEIMIKAAVELGITAPKMKCDPYNVSRWYADSAAVAVRSEFEKLEKKESRDEAIEDLCKKHPEFTRECILKSIETGCDLDF